MDGRRGDRIRAAGRGHGGCWVLGRKGERREERLEGTRARRARSRRIAGLGGSGDGRKRRAASSAQLALPARRPAAVGPWSQGESTTDTSTGRFNFAQPQPSHRRRHVRQGGRPPRPSHHPRPLWTPRRGEQPAVTSFVASWPPVAPRQFWVAWS